jgi:HNH endonuclease
MEKLTAQQLGGRSSAIKQRSAAIAAYEANPNKCLHCAIVIPIRDGLPISILRRNRFCSQRCAAFYSHALRPKVAKPPKPPRKARLSSVPGTTKSELFAKRRGYQSARSAIRHDANRSYDRSGKPKCCLVCGYSTHIEICHVRPVSQFPGSALIADINASSNLVALCPLHHWEFDNGVLELQAAA